MSTCNPGRCFYVGLPCHARLVQILPFLSLIFQGLGIYRWRVSLGQRCLLLGWWSRFPYPSTLRRPTFKWHPEEPSTMQQLTLWSGSKAYSFFPCYILRIFTSSRVASRLSYFRTAVGMIWICRVMFLTKESPAAFCRVRKFPGQTELTMSAEVELISTMVEKKSWTRPPIQMEFQVGIGSFWNVFMVCDITCT